MFALGGGHAGVGAVEEFVGVGGVGEVGAELGFPAGQEGVEAVDDGFVGEVPFLFQSEDVAEGVEELGWVLGGHDGEVYHEGGGVDGFPPSGEQGMGVVVGAMGVGIGDGRLASRPYQMGEEGRASSRTPLRKRGEDGLPPTREQGKGEGGFGSNLLYSIWG